METLETKTPEFETSSEQPVEDKKETKAAARSEKAEQSDQKQSPKLFGDSSERVSMFDNPKAKSKEVNLYDLFEQNADKNPPLEDLAKDEQDLVVADQTAENLVAANNELVGTEPSTPAEAAAIAGATYNEAVRERMDNGQDLSPDMLDGAMNDTAEILGLNPDDITEDEPELPIELEPEAADAEPIVAINESEPAESAEPEEPEEPEQPATPDLAEPLEPTATDAVEPDDTTPPAAPASPVPPAGAAGPHGPGPAPGAAGPGAPFGPGGPGGPGGGGGGPDGPGFGPGGFNMNPGPGINMAANLASAAPWLNPNIAAGLAANRLASPNRRHSHLPYVLAGGVVGYLVGRRRGRINTEKKLLPVQKKLEQQVGDLQYQVAAREAKIRKLAYEKAASNPQLFVDLPKRLKELQELQKLSLKKADFAEAAKNTAEKTKRSLAKEAAAVAVSSELLTRISDMAERTQTARPEQEPARSIPKAETAKRAKDMSTAELLVVAAQIPIEDRDLRHLYETGRIAESDMRRIIEAYMRGERYDKVLNESLKPGDGIETASSLPDVDEQHVAAVSPVDTRALGAQTNQTLMADPKFVSARHEYYEKLSFDEPAPEENQTPRAIVVIGVGVAVAIALFLVFG